MHCRCGLKFRPSAARTPLRRIRPPLPVGAVADATLDTLGHVSDDVQVPVTDSRK